MKEVWKDIKDYEGIYQISNFGRVKSLNYKSTGPEKIMKLQEHKNGYFTVMLYKDGRQKRVLVHRLVAEVFIANPYNLPCINHKDENTSNNHISNLEWCSYKYNNNYGNHNERLSESHKGDKNQMYGRTKEKHPMYGMRLDKNPNSKKVICITTGEIFNSIKEAESKTNSSHVADCCNGKRKSAGKHPITREKLVWGHYNEKVG